MVSAVTPAQVRQLEIGVVGAGVLAFFATFLPFYGVRGSAALFGRSVDISWTAWHSYAVAGSVMLVAATALAAIRALAPATLPSGLALGPYVAVAGLAAMGTALILLRALTWPHVSALGLDPGVRWGAFALVVCGAAQTALAILAARATGERLPRVAVPGEPIA